jgi:gliding motility-associated-like protein
MILSQNMYSPISKKKQYLQLVLCILFFNFSFGHLANFALDVQVTPTNETCPGNGRLDFLVTNPTPGGTIIYTIYKLPNLTTPIVTTQLNMFTGLVAANYRVVATESLPNGDINTQQVDTVILNRITPLQVNYLVTPQTCLQRGSITVTTLSGQPVLFEIIAGPNAPVSQTSTIFTNLVSGNYQIKITDNCGAFITQNITVDYLNPNLVFGGNTVTLQNCASIDVKNTITASTGQIMYPLTIVYTIYDPSGNTTTSSQVVTSGDLNLLLLSQPIAFYYDQFYHYAITVTDSCGNVFNSSDFTLHPEMEVTSDIGVSNCNTKKIQISVNEFGFPPFTASFLNAPAGFVPTVFNTLHPNFSSSPFVYYNSSTPLPTGNYEVQVTDACGRSGITNFVIDNNQPLLPNIVVSQLKGCAAGYSSLNININNIAYQIVSADLAAAPATYTTTLPLNLNSFIYNGQIYLSNLTSGSYQFKITDSCGNVRDVFVNVVGYQITSNNFSVINGCSQFSLDLRNVSNIPSSLVTYWIQKFNPSTNEWVHPITGVSSSNRINNNNALSLLNNSVNVVNNSTGRFRIVKYFYSFKLPTSTNLSSIHYCIEELGEFEFYFEPKIKDIYSFSCGNNLYQVIVDVVGVAPFRYEIIEKDGVPFYIDNGNSSVFDNVAPGVYKFRVTDSCGNEKLRLFEVSGNVVLTIAATPFCEGSVGSLRVPFFPYLQYEWWKDTASSTILSTTNVLGFNPFSNANNVGTYHVRITNPGNPNTCISFIVDYTIHASSPNPNAGGDATVSYCGRQGTVNLFSILSGAYDTNGLWQEISNSGTLTGNLWNSTTVTPGTYRFKYTVNGSCGFQDEALVTITINEIPQTPIATFDPIVCDSGILQLYATAVLGATYVWNGPNGFNSTLQNPSIANISASNNGVYTVIAVKNGCNSGMNSVEIDVKNTPDFSISTTCFNGSKQLYIEPIGNTIAQEFSNYVWTFPDGTSHTGNPISIATGDAGEYSVAVQNQEGCFSSKEITIKCTSCGYIPKGVSANGDNLNEAFDLHCLENVKNVKIYNRYGVLLFDQDHYVKEWKGQDKNGALLPTATYYYQITFNSGETKTGWVYLTY